MVVLGLLASATKPVASLAFWSIAIIALWFPLTAIEHRPAVHAFILFLAGTMFAISLAGTYISPSGQVDAFLVVFLAFSEAGVAWLCRMAYTRLQAARGPGQRDRQTT